MNFITDCLKADASYRHLLEAIQEKNKKIYLHGLVKESMGHILVSILEHLNRPIFVVSERSQRAIQVAEEIGSLAPGRAMYYPEQEFNFYNIDRLSTEVKSQRIQVMNRLSKKEAFVVSTTLSAMGRYLTPPKRFNQNTVHLSIGDDIELEDLADLLFEMRYERVSTVEHKGQYSIRGGLLDIYPLAKDNPIRIEFFDTEVDSIRFFDITSQRSVDNVDEISIEPAEELQFNGESYKKIIKRMSKELARSLEKNEQKQDRIKLQDKFSSLLTHLEEGNLTSNDDLLSPYLDDTDKASIIDYLPKNAIIIFDDFARILEYEQEKERFLFDDISQLLEKGEILPSHKKVAIPLKETTKHLVDHTMVNISQILKRLPLIKVDELIQMKTIEAESFANRWEDLIRALHARKKSAYRILIFAGKGAQVLQRRLMEDGVFCKLSKDGNIDVDPGDIVIIEKYYPKGYHLPDDKLLFVTNFEITGKDKKSRKKASRKPKKNLFDYQDLQIGDFVVHENYGIGEYLGTKSMEIQGVTKDYLEIKYRGTDTLYVSTDEMDLVAKYIGNSGKAPKLSSLGTKEWTNSKARVKKAIDEIADDLVELYAKRSKIEGYAFSEDTPWQQAFEDAFPYTETPSQLRAVEEIKADMEEAKPMDRLLCGDVGYGKTEVALRAAFKAVMDGKQVAFLCPTTILTQQHYATMKERFQGFPMRIEFLSRFKTASQQREIIKALNRGAVDIVVGTHRVLSKDISFKDLGLLIIDEEQRFGVKDKEKIKQIKENVDVLTLSATPIPRTLQMSLTGIRDMSLLEEPPEERYPTTTFILEYDAGIIQNAIERELDRDGQIYFVYNRVHDLYKIEERLHQLVPDAVVGVAHGKMSTRELENVMEAFVSGEIDILLSTTIIETGMDIANVNTLIIYNADHMGLSQLYQLKGRIGRSDRKSYAFFTYEANKVLSEVSEKRLKAIRDFTEFGSGYKIAMRDLELRGAGNLLGESQSGQVESVGYDLYVKMLENAVAKAKGKSNRERLEGITVDIKVDTYIADSYIPHTIDKISMYRKIASLETLEEYQDILEELFDRFGEMPEAVINIMDVALIRRLAGELGFTKIVEANDYVELRYDAFEQFSVEFLKEISENYEGPLTFDFQGDPKFKIKSTPKKLADVKSLLLLMKGLKDITRTKKEDDNE